MTALTRILELLGTHDAVEINFAKCSNRCFVLQANNMVSHGSGIATRRVAQGSGETLQEAAERLVASAERVGMLAAEDEPMPETQPAPKTGDA